MSGMPCSALQAGCACLCRDADLQKKKAGPPATLCSCHSVQTITRVKMLLVISKTSIHIFKAAVSADWQCLRIPKPCDLRDRPRPRQRYTPNGVHFVCTVAKSYAYVSRSVLDAIYSSYSPTRPIINKSMALQL
jgi:hypothetical protein